MASLSETRDRIRLIVTDRVGCITIDRDGDLTFPAGHARMFIAVKPFGRSHVVDVTGITNWEVPTTPKLFKHIAVHANRWVIGHLGCQLDAETGTAAVTFSHRLVAEGLEPDALMDTIRVVARSSDAIAQEIAARFSADPARPAAQA